MTEPVDPDAGTARLGSTAIDGQISYKLRLAQIVAYRAFEGVVTGFGAAPRYLGLLCLIRDNPGQAQSRLAEAVALQRSSLVTILDRLEADGLVERRTVSGDRRMKQVWLTPEGGRVVDLLLPQAEAHEAALTAGLSATDKALFLRALDQVVQNLS